MSRRGCVLLLVGTAQVIWALVNATKYDIMAGYLGSDCNDTAPYTVYARPNGGCGDGICYEYAVDQRASTDCSKEQDMRDFFGSSPYIIQALYSDDDCSTFEFAIGFLATNSCLGGNLTTGLYYESRLDADGSATVVPYYEYVGSMGSMEGDNSCSASDTTLSTITIGKDGLDCHSCVPLGTVSAVYDYFGTDSANSVHSYRWYSSNDEPTGTENSSSNSSESFTTESDGSSVSISGVVLIVLAGIILVAVCFAFICYRDRSKAKHTSSFASPRSRDTTSLEVAISGQRDNGTTTSSLQRGFCETKAKSRN